MGSRSHIYIRPLRLDDEADIAAFHAAIRTSQRFIPHGALSLHTTKIMVAEKDGKIIAYQPMYASLVLGSFVPSASVTDTELASAQHQFTAAAFTRCHTERFADIVIFSETPETLAFAERHGYVEAHKAMRLEVR